MTVLISDIIDFRAKNITRVQDSLNNDKTVNSPRRYNVPNVYTPNNGASKYMKRRLIEVKAEIDKSVIYFFNHLCPPTSGSDPDKSVILKI